MRIEKEEFVTKISNADSIKEINASREELGSPCMLIVYGIADLNTEEGFPADTPFITAFAADDTENVNSSVRNCFDLIICAENADEYVRNLFKDKSRSQINEINACFIAARNGSQEDVLSCESKAFYRLMAEKNGGAGNE